MATSGQASFIRDLFDQCETLIEQCAAKGNADSLVERVASVQSTIVAVLSLDPVAIDEVSMSDASAAIDTLKAVKSDAYRIASKVDVPAGLAGASPSRVIVNRYAKKCEECGERVDEQKGYAVQWSNNGAWFTFCAPCADESEDDRAKRLDTERAAEALFDDMVRQLFDRAGVADNKATKSVGIAVPDQSGRNDLRFFHVVRKPSWDHAEVTTVIGGRSDSPLDREPALAALATMLALPSVPEAMLTFGREIGQCPRCGETLTDETSRSRGIGPVCATKQGA
jgi:hypothetical protein